VTETRRITYQGSAPVVRTLVKMLEAEGVTVEVRRGGPPAMEQRDTRMIVEQVLINLAATGTFEGIKAGVRKFRASFPGAKVAVEGEDDDGPIFRKGRMG
jgi:hypothetical protein